MKEDAHYSLSFLKIILFQVGHSWSIFPSKSVWNILTNVNQVRRSFMILSLVGYLWNSFLFYLSLSYITPPWSDIRFTSLLLVWHLFPHTILRTCPTLDIHRPRLTSCRARVSWQLRDSWQLPSPEPELPPPSSEKVETSAEPSGAGGTPTQSQTQPGPDQHMTVTCDRRNQWHNPRALLKLSLNHNNEVGSFVRTLSEWMIE